ncbi:MAG: MBL fold metallo-hydrolase [Bacteroidales bacterium]|nr:MBL fold metallo-hydrolase [Bacteroidales bacterium]
MNNSIIIIIFLSLTNLTVMAQKNFSKDRIPAEKGDIYITFIGHGTLMLEYNKTVIHVDPWSRLADYSALPKADIVLLTHGHRDHFDTTAIAAVRKPETQVVLTPEVYSILGKGVVMENGDRREISGIVIDAVPAYNITPGRENFHPKGRDNGYIVWLGGKRIYIAGDTENIPEMAAISGVDVAFLPMNQPFTMTPEQVVAAARVLRPKILYPYHYGETDVSLLKNLMKGVDGVELRIRDMK